MLGEILFFDFVVGLDLEFVCYVVGVSQVMQQKWQVQYGCWLGNFWGNWLFMDDVYWIWFFFEFFIEGDGLYGVWLGVQGDFVSLSDEIFLVNGDSLFFMFLGFDFVVVVKQRRKYSSGEQDISMLFLLFFFIIVEDVNQDNKIKMWLFKVFWQYFFLFFSMLFSFSVLFYVVISFGSQWNDIMQMLQFLVWVVINDCSVVVFFYVQILLQFLFLLVYKVVFKGFKVFFGKVECRLVYLFQY